MATKVRITGLEGAAKTVKTKIGRAIKRSGFEVEFQQDVVDEIRNRGLPPKLSPSTIKQRRYLAQHNTTHKNYEASKSNLTFSGELLNSLRIKFQVSKLVFNFDSLKRKHKRYVNGAKKTASIRDIYDYLEDQGRSISSIFDRKKFISSVAGKLKKSILEFYRN